MRKIIVTGLIILISFLGAQTDVSQDDNNITFLNELDKNLLSTIDLLVAFNTIANNMVAVEGADLYRKFLMEMTLECGQLRNAIEAALDLTPAEREEKITYLILTLCSDVELKTPENSPEMNKKNREELASYEREIKKRIAALRTRILREEQGVKEGNSITKSYLNVHSLHYIFSLLLDYLEASHYLSAENQDYLKQIITAIMSEI